MDYIPSTQEGYLPLGVFVVGCVAIWNAVQCYTSIANSHRLYQGRANSVTGKARQTSNDDIAARSPATPLSARTLGTWNFAVGIARIYASYHLNQASWYQMSMWTNVLGLFHFGTECFVYSTAQPRGAWWGPIIVASTTLVWHLVQYEHYVKYA